MALLDLISQGGAGIKSPAQRFIETKRQMAAEDSNRLSDLATRQSIDIQQQQNVRAESQNTRAEGVFRAKQKENFGKSITPFLESINKEKEEDRDAAYQGFLPEINRIGVDNDIDPSRIPTVYSQELSDSFTTRFSKKEKPLFTTPAAKDFTSESRKTFKVTGDQSDLVPIKKVGPITNINLEGASALTKAIGKKAGEQIVANKELAIKAGGAIRNANEAIKLLNSGVITGFGAEFITNLGRAVTQLGFDTGDAIKNTQAFAANQGKAVLDILGSGALGAGTGISDNDRLFAKQIAGGDITLEEDSIRRIVELNAKVSKNVIERHNADFEKIRSKSPIDLSVELPEFFGIEKPLSEDEQTELDRLRGNK